MRTRAVFATAVALSVVSLIAAAAHAAAGYDRGFTVGTDDGAWLLRINVEAQVRAVYDDTRGGVRGVDREENGFVIRRARLDLNGRAAGPRMFWRLRLNADRANGNAFIEHAWAGIDLGAGWSLTAGRLKPRFIREEAVDGFRQLAVERSYVSDYFTIDFTEGVEAACTRERWRCFAAVHDGSYAAGSEFNADRTIVALSARVEAAPVGGVKQLDDYSCRSGEKSGAALSAAVDYELGEQGGPTRAPDIFKYAGEASAQAHGATVFVAFQGQTFENVDTAGTGGLPGALMTAHQRALVVQGGVFVVRDRVEIFARDEWIDFDGVYYRNNGATVQSGTAGLARSELDIATAGVVVYARSTKFTLDALYAFDPVPVANTGSGLAVSTKDGQTVVRAQMQWSF